MGGEKKAWRGILWVLPSLIGICLFYFLPWTDVIRRSFLSATGGSFVGLKNYRQVLENGAFFLAARNTVCFALICIPALIILSLLLAAFVVRSRGGAVSKSIYLLPMSLPASSAALVWEVLFADQGMVNRCLHLAGLPDIRWLDTSAAFWVLVFCYLWKNLGYDLVLWTAGLSRIPESICEAARVDGAGERQIFFRIILPQLRPVLYTIAVLSLLNSFKVFREAYLIAGNYPHDSMYMLQHLFNNWFSALALDKLSAASVLLSLALVGLICVIYRFWGKEEQ